MPRIDAATDAGGCPMSRDAIALNAPGIDEAMNRGDSAAAL